MATMDDVDDIAAALKDDIWPNPLKFYTGDMQVRPPAAGAGREARQAQHTGSGCLPLSGSSRRCLHAGVRAVGSPDCARRQGMTRRAKRALRNEAARR